MSHKDAAAPQTIVGWREYVALPEWGVSYVKAKIDTGARTSAIDVANLRELGDDRVQFELMVDRLHDHRQLVEAKVVRRTRVKSSFGSRQDRHVVQTTLKLGSIEKTIELSLMCRKDMHCRMLLGRKALEPDILVDPGRRYLHGLRPRRKRQATSEKLR